MPTGTLRRYSDTGGYGWITSDDGIDTFCHVSKLRLAGIDFPRAGMRHLGRRWVKVQFPIIRGLEDCVVEIQDKAQVDLLAGQVTFNWNLIDPAALSALQ